MKYHYYMTRFDFAPDVLSDLRELVDDLNNYQGMPCQDVIDGINWIHCGGFTGKRRVHATIYEYDKNDLLQCLGSMLFRNNVTAYEIVQAVKRKYPQAREIVMRESL